MQSQENLQLAKSGKFNNQMVRPTTGGMGKSVTAVLCILHLYACCQADVVLHPFNFNQHNYNAQFYFS